MTGKLGKDSKFTTNFENLFLESIAVLPAPNEAVNNEQSPKDIPLTESPDGVEAKEARPVSRGLSLADLGVSFEDDDHAKPPEISVIDDDNGKDFQILCRDVATILAFLLWIVKVEWTDTQYPFENNDSCKEEIDVATNIVNSSIANFTYSDDASDLPCILRSQFHLWKTQAAPNLFKGLQSFIYNKFAMLEQATIHSTSSRSEIVLSPDTTPKPDKTELLSPIYAAMLSWNLPENAMSQKQWNLLYNADTDGYAMNNFISHVFKYPGMVLSERKVEV
jgi:hypothetical protein